jgi:hypothetical protein
MKLTLRLPDELYEALKALAEKDHRSLNAQVVWLLGIATEFMEGTHRGLAERAAGKLRPWSEVKEELEIPAEESHQSDTMPSLAERQERARGDNAHKPIPGPPLTAEFRAGVEEALAAESAGDTGEPWEKVKGDLGKPVCTCAPAERRLPKGKLGPHKLGCPAK